MRKAIFTLVILLFIPLPAFAAKDMFGKMPDFSGIMITQSGGSTQSMKFYYTKTKQRAEPMGESGVNAVIITRLDKELVWMVMPDQKAYMEMPISQLNSNPLTSAKGAAKVQKLGEETIEGHRCTKNKVTVKEQDGETMTMYVWDAADLGWPIQAEAIDGSWRYTFTEIKIAKQRPSLFELPKGYERMEGFRGPSATGSAPDVASPPEAPEPPVPDVPSLPSLPIPW